MEVIQIAGDHQCVLVLEQILVHLVHKIVKTLIQKEAFPIQIEFANNSNTSRIQFNSNSNLTINQVLFNSSFSKGKINN